MLKVKFLKSNQEFVVFFINVALFVSQKEANMFSGTGPSSGTEESVVRRKRKTQLH